MLRLGPQPIVGGIRVAWGGDYGNPNSRVKWRDDETADWIEEHAITQDGDVVNFQEVYAWSIGK